MSKGEAMMELDQEAARDFEALDAREAQAALAEELTASSDAPDQDEASGEADTAEDTIELVNDGETDADAGDGASNGNDDSGDADGEEAAAEIDDPVWTAAQDAEHLRMIEAILFAASEPLDVKTIAARLPQGVDVLAMLEVLTAHYENRGVHLAQIAGKWRFATAEDVSHVLETERIEPRKLSRAALETLAIIAYHQPCTRADIEDVRGVAVSKGSLDQLLEIGWARLRGRRKDSPGRPVLYGTTQAFLEHFGLAGVDDLPGLADLKAAGLLDARLPPGFSVPTPSDADGEEETGDEDAEDVDFAQDFMDGEEVDDAADLAESDLVD